MTSIWNENKPTQYHGQSLFKALIQTSNFKAQENLIKQLSATENGMQTLRLASKAGKLAIKNRAAKVNAQCEEREYESCGDEVQFTIARINNYMQREELLRNIDQGMQVVNLLDHYIQMHDLEKVTGVTLRR